MSNMLEKWKQKARKLKKQVFIANQAYRDPRLPWSAKIATAIVLAYAFSPIDLIPDFIPILGYLDDLILIPVGISMVIKLIPLEVWNDAKLKVEAEEKNTKPVNWVAGMFIIGIWLSLLIIVIWKIMH